MKLARPALGGTWPAPSSGWPRAPCSAGWGAGKNALRVGDRRSPEQRIHNCPPNKLSFNSSLADGDVFALDRLWHELGFNEIAGLSGQLA